MSFDAKKGFCFCDRCGHDWRARNKHEKPTSCAKCKSKVWDAPRVYTGKWSPVVMARRFKKTGRAAKTPNNTE